MRILMLLIVVILVPVVVAMVVTQRRGAARHQAEPIDAERAPDLPGPETTERMADPPPGSQGDRSRHGKP